MEVRNYLIDSIRLIAALFVIFLHIPLENFNEEFAVHLRLLSRWAVPVFLMFSGYFVSLKVKKNDAYFISYITKLLGIILISTLIYVPFALSNVGLGYFIYKFDWIFLGAYYHLWFLIALIFSTLVYMFFYMNKIERILDLFSIFLLFFFVTIMDYGYLFGITINQNVPLLFLSIFFFNFGTHLKQLFSNTLKSKLISILLLITGVCIQEIEIFFLDGKSSYDPLDFQMLYGTILFSIGVIGCSFSFKQTKSNWVSKLGMKYALFIYIYHVLLVETFKAFDINGTIVLLSPFIIITISILVAIILERKLPKIYNILNGEFK
ncbi:acyltransferase family protein [Flavobacteriaceae bacterium]|nr:acyltransferase family protein [Flavobacteriaceae bacterium]